MLLSTFVSSRNNGAGIFLKTTQNNMAEAKWREKNCNVNCVPINSFFFLYLTESGESSCGIQSQGVV